MNHPDWAVIRTTDSRSSEGVVTHPGVIDAILVTQAVDPTVAPGGLGTSSRFGTQPGALLVTITRYWSVHLWKQSSKGH